MREGATICSNAALKNSGPGGRQLDEGRCEWCCRYLISQHPEVERKILAELEGLQLLKTPQNPRPREMAYADLSKLTYLNAVIKVSNLASCSENLMCSDSQCLLSALKQ